MKELICPVKDLVTHITALKPSRLVCSAQTEVNITFIFHDVYNRGNTQDMWEKHEFGKIYGVSITSGIIPNGKVKLLIE